MERYQKMTLGVSIISIVFSIINIVLITPFAFMGFGILAMFFYRESSSIWSPGGFPLSSRPEVFVAVIALILCLMNLILNIILLIGSVKRKVRLVRFWYIGTIILTVIYVIRSLLDFILATKYGNFDLILGAFFYFLLGGLYTALTFLVVLGFMKELKAGGPERTVVLGMNEPESIPYRNLEDES